jgi:hypothetical protein
MTDGPTPNDALVAELTDARADLFAALDRVAPESLTTPGLIGEWSARELIAHLGYWAGHGAEVIHAVEEGRLDEAGEGEPPVDEVNETVARVARDTPLAAVHARETASFEALAERLERVDPTLLVERLPDGETVEEAVREDGANHYREHADELSRILGERPRG